MKQVFRKAATNVLAISIGVVYFWFGALKFFPHLSPAEILAKNTIEILDFGLIPSHASIILLAIWEVCLGLMLVFNLFRRWALGLAIIHIVLTFTPMLFFPELIFNNGPFTLTLLGQYIIKNIVILSILLSLFIDDKGITTDLQSKELRLDSSARKRVVQYSWQAQRVSNGSMGIVSLRKSEVMVDNQF